MSHAPDAGKVSANHVREVDIELNGTNKQELQSQCQEAGTSHRIAYCGTGTDQIMLKQIRISGGTGGKHVGQVDSVPQSLLTANSPIAMARIAALASAACLANAISSDR